MPHESGQNPSATRTIFDRDIIRPATRVLAPAGDPVLTLRGVVNDSRLASVEGLAYADGVVHCACFSGRYTSVNVEDPDNPFVIGSYLGAATPAVGLNGTTEIVLSETGVPILVAYGFGNLTSIDNTDPANPTLLHTIYRTVSGGTVPVNQMLHLRGIIRRGNFAFATSDQAALFAFNISDPANLGYMSHISTATTGANLSWAWHIAGNEDNTIAYITLQATSGGAARVTCVDISDPWNMVILGSTALSPTGQGWGMSYRGGYCYVGMASRFLVVDVSDPTNPVQVGSAGTLTVYGTAPLYNDYALACWPQTTDGIICYNVSDPVTPTTGWTGSSLTNLTSLNGARDVIVNPNGRFAYVACYDGSRLAVIEIS